MTFWNAVTCHRFRRRDLSRPPLGPRPEPLGRQAAQDQSGEVGSPAGQPGWGACQVTALQRSCVVASSDPSMGGP